MVDDLDNSSELSFAGTVRDENNTTDLAEALESGCRGGSSNYCVGLHVRMGSRYRFEVARGSRIGIGVREVRRKSVHQPI